MPVDLSVISRTASAALLPPEALSLAQWSERHRVLHSGPEHGPFRLSRMAHLRAPMDLLSGGSRTQRVVCVFSSQTGKSTIGQNWYGYTVHHSPTSMLVLLPTDKLLRRLVKGPIAKEIETIAEVRSRMRAVAADRDQSFAERSYLGGTAYFGTAGSSSDLAQISVERLWIDEPDRMEDIQGEGDPISLGMKRTSAFGRRAKVLLTSTPTGDDSRIWRAYLDADQREYWVPCPHCGQMMMLTFDRLTWPQGRPKEAEYECPYCRVLIPEHEKNRMLPAGQWAAWIEDDTARADAMSAVAEEMGIEVPERLTWEMAHHQEWLRRACPTQGEAVGFHLNFLAIPYGWDSWGKCASEFVQASRSADSERLRVWTNTRDARPYLGLPEDKIEHAALHALCEPYARPVPDPVAVLVRVVDQQDDRLETAVIGWTPGYDGYAIDHEVLLGDPGTHDLWDELGARMADRYDGMLPVVTLVDTGGHYTQQAVDFCARHKRYGALPIKGASLRDALLWPLIRQRRDHSVNVVGVHKAREILWLKLSRTPDQTGRLHFPSSWEEAYRDEYFRQLTAEQRIKRRVKGRIEYDFVKRYARNEVFDLWVYAIVAYEYLRGVKRVSLMDEHERRYSANKSEIKPASARKNSFLPRRNGWI